MLEMSRKDNSRELERVPHDEAEARGVPRDDRVESRGVDEVEGLRKKRRNRVDHLQGLGTGRVVAIVGVHVQRRRMRRGEKRKEREVGILKGCEGGGGWRGDGGGRERPLHSESVCENEF